MFCLIFDDRYINFRNRQTSAPDIETINKYLVHHHDKHMGEDEKPVTPEDIYIDLREGNQDDITVILEKNKRA